MATVQSLHEKMNSDLHTEVERFKIWAAETFPSEERSGEWECDYPDWDHLYTAFEAFIYDRPVNSWSDAETKEVLYAIARDIEWQHLAAQIRERAPHTLRYLALESIRVGERNAKWQMAVELGKLGAIISDAESILLRMVCDEDEYVRRRALTSLAVIGSRAVERLAVDAWHRPDEDQQWARMAALWCLHRIRSPMLEQFLAAADEDEREYLVGYAHRIRHGEVES